MRAIVIATGGQGETSAGVAGSRASPMLPLVDRPVLQHLVELLASRGFRRLEIVLGDRPELAEEALGDGRRWGVSIRYHLARDPARPYDVLRRAMPDDGPALLVHADRLLDPTGRDPAAGAGPEALFADGRWTGWARVDPASLLGLPDGADEDDLAEHLIRGGLAVRGVPAHHVLDVRTASGLLSAQKALLSGRFPALMLGGIEAEPGVRIGRNVSLHPSARLIPPVAISEDCRIGAEARIGPNVAVGAGSLIDSGSELSWTAVFPGVYIGRGLEIREALIEGPRVTSARHDRSLAIEDPTLMDRLGGTHSPGPIATAFLRLASAAALVALAPILLAVYAWLRLRGPAIVVRQIVLMPQSTRPTRWRVICLRHFRGADPRGTPGLRDLALRVLPGLIDVVLGRVALVGLEPRTAVELLDRTRIGRQVPPCRPAGLITEAMVALDRDAPEDERDMAEAAYAALAGTRRDLALLGRYLARCLSIRG